MSGARLTSDPQGYNDVYWCNFANQPVLANNHNGKCFVCQAYLRDSGVRGYGHQFLAHVYKGDAVTEMQVIAEVVKGTDEAEAEIEVLRDAIGKFAQQVHQAYHGAHPPDLCDVNYTECPRGLCRSAQHVLNPKRPRGQP